MKFILRTPMYAWDKMGQGYTFGAYEFTTLPGCSQVVVSHGVFIYEECRGKGLSVYGAKERIHSAQEHGYDAMVCTVDMTNEPQLKTLAKTGWIKACEFKSRKTGHLVGIFTKVLSE